MTEPEAPVQATANLSPVSPSPVHTAAAQVVPALQDTVDTIDAMVAAALAPNGVPVPDETNHVGAGLDDGDNDGIVDDDSFDDAYAEDAAEVPAAEAPHAPEQLDSNDDYAKTFDSPIEPEEGEGSEDVPHHVSSSSSSVPRESNEVSLASDHLTSHPSDAPSAALDLAAAAAAAPSAAHSEADSQPPAKTSSQPPIESRQPDLPAALPQPAAQSAPTDFQDPAADIQRLVADLTSQPVEPSSAPDPAVQSSAQPDLAAAANSLTSSALPSSSFTLPPRPPLPHSASQSYASQHHPAGSNAAAAAVVSVAPPTPGQPSTYVAAGAPGTTTDPIGSLPPPPATGLNAPVAITSLTAPPYPAATPAYSNDRSPDTDHHREWEQFMSDERQYMSEAKWDRFPEGSRIFIGNLSSDKVSKRDVFDLFHRFGRLAQISLKSAYGFVQYHTVDEGRRALENLQGFEIKGRRIHLEISRVQDKAKKERGGRSPDRSGRGREGRGRNERSSQQSRDDYRPGRTQSPRRNEFHRDDGFSRDRGFYESERGGRRRSQSPSFRRSDTDNYRRRSPSPYGRSRNSTSELDLPRRYGADVPDVQIILQPEVNRDFVAWVEAAFKSKSLKTEVMYLHPRIPKDQVIQRQAAEGVHAVVDLDLRAQNLGRIPVQAFDRSGGMSNVRFDQYVDLDPNTAAEVILRAKASGAPQYSQPYAGAPSGYSQPYGAQQPQHGAGYPAAYPQQQQQPQAPAAAADLAGLIGQVDNATLQRLLASIQTPQASHAGHPAGHPAGHHGGANPAAAAISPQVDIQAILGSLNGNTPQQPTPAQPQYGAPYGGAQAAPHGIATQAPGANGDAAAQVQNIMAQLARFRQ